VRNTVQQGLYLASSWLWCIGAFLPLLIMRDYGTGALVLFAAVNVGGAAAFGYVMSRRNQAEFMAAHRSALNAFSHVTIAFQIYFVCWLSSLVGWWLLGIMLVLAVLFYLGHTLLNWITAALFIGSILLFRQHLETFPLTGLSWTLQAGWWHTLLPFALGFILCPYLDLTFHRALQQSQRGSLSFALGFLVLFLALLLFVFSYVDELSQLFSGEGTVSAASLWPVIAFITLQTAFTVAVHSKEYFRFNAVKAAPVLRRYAVYGVALVLFMALFHGQLLPWLEVPVTEVLYKSFLLFYGLITPLYLLLPRQRPWLLAAILLTAPTYSLGFVLGGDSLLYLSISMVLVVMLIVAGRRFTQLQQR
jgi:hypothetical protein